MDSAVNREPRLTTSAMIASIASEGQRTKSAPFGQALVVEAEKRPEIVGMTADLSKYTDLHIFERTYPERYFQMGMAEQLLMGAVTLWWKRPALAALACRYSPLRTSGSAGRRRPGWVSATTAGSLKLGSERGCAHCFD